MEYCDQWNSTHNSWQKYLNSQCYTRWWVQLQKAEWYHKPPPINQLHLQQLVSQAMNYYKAKEIYSTCLRIVPSHSIRTPHLQHHVCPQIPAKQRRWHCKHIPMSMCTHNCSWNIQQGSCNYFQHNSEHFPSRIQNSLSTVYNILYSKAAVVNI